MMTKPSWFRKRRNIAKAKFQILYRASAPFIETKKKYISKICSVGVRHKWLKYPALVAALFFILFANIAFYLCLWVLTHKKGAVGLAAAIAAALVLWFMLPDRGAEGSEGRVSVVSEAESEAADGVVKDDTVDITHKLFAKGNEEDAAESDPPKPIAVAPVWYRMRAVDFTELKSINSDVIGWIFFENGDISYPILQGQTNDEYIDTSYDGKSSRAGAIYIESENKPDFSDLHTLIYGQDMRNDSMFGSLRNYSEEEDYIDDHDFFQIITPTVSYRYEIVSYKNVPKNDLIYQIFDSNTVGFSDFLDGKIMSGMYVKHNYIPDCHDHVVTLSTCPSDDGQFVVSAVRVEEHRR